MVKVLVYRIEATESIAIKDGGIAVTDTGIGRVPSSLFSRVNFGASRRWWNYQRSILHNF